MGFAVAGSFFKSVDKLEPIEVKRVLKAVNTLSVDRDHPGLNFERIRSKRNDRLFSIRASDELRILVAQQGDVMVAVHAGHHDAVYELAERSAFVAGRNERTFGMLQLSGASRPQLAYESGEFGSSDTCDLPGVLDHWSTSELEEVGFRSELVSELRELKDSNNILDAIPDITEDELDLFIKVLELSPEEFHNPEPEFNVLLTRITSGQLGNLSDLMSAEELAELTSRPIEAWMVFLHPDQRVLVSKSFSGPARVRGSAGTGKTVVALHRAAHLAKQRRGTDSAPILFTTYVRSLPRVLERLYQRVPGTVPGEVQFDSLHSVAHSVCANAGASASIDTSDVRNAFVRAYNRVVKGSVFQEYGEAENSYAQEIFGFPGVVKGLPFRMKMNSDVKCWDESDMRGCCSEEGTRLGIPTVHQVL